MICCENFSSQLLLDRIKYIRTYHQFDPQPDRSVVHRRTSNSTDSEKFSYATRNSSQSLVRKIIVVNDLQSGQFCIVELNDDLLLARVKTLDPIEQKVLFDYYEPPFPSMTFRLSPSKRARSSIIDVQNVILCIVDTLSVTKRNAINLSQQQFIDIQNMCDER